MGAEANWEHSEALKQELTFGNTLQMRGFFKEESPFP